uniref:Uncharacterized protein n=1 Tax=Rhizophora mucronata TaxID=61149 RepID=A0A2P2PQ53_RHIMU
MLCMVILSFPLLKCSLSVHVWRHQFFSSLCNLMYNNVILC